MNGFGIKFSRLLSGLPGCGMRFGPSARKTCIGIFAMSVEIALIAANTVETDSAVTLVTLTFEVLANTPAKNDVQPCSVAMLDDADIQLPTLFRIFFQVVRIDLSLILNYKDISLLLN